MAWVKIFPSNLKLINSGSGLSDEILNIMLLIEPSHSSHDEDQTNTARGLHK